MSDWPHTTLSCCSVLVILPLRSHGRYFRCSATMSLCLGALPGATMALSGALHDSNINPM